MADTALVDRELRLLLRWRLLIALILALWGHGLLFAAELLSLPGSTGVATTWVRRVVVVIFALESLILLRVPTLSIRRLRLLELIAIGGNVAYAIVDNQTPLDSPISPTLLTGSMGWTVMLWFAGITIYGVMIPNSLRRAMVVNGVLAALAIASLLIACVRWGVPAEDLPYMVVDVFMWIGLAASFSVFNSARVESYRRASVEARELGHYRLGRKLGGGGMGEVFLAEHRFLKRPCAIKLIHPRRVGDPSALARFEREVQSTASLTHPNTVNIYDYGRADDGTFYCVMEYLPGLTLEELIARHGPLSPARVVFLLRQLCSALAEAHASGLIHRDIKPSNVIVGERGGLADTVKVLDFGLVLDSSANERLSQDRTLIGTPAYMAPEQAGEGAIDCRVDIYGIGAVGYFLLTGQPLFRHRTVFQMIAAVLRESPVALGEVRPDTPADLTTVIMRCVAKDPQERYASAAELEAALMACECSLGWSHSLATQWWRGAHDAMPTVQSATPTTCPYSEHDA